MSEDPQKVDPLNFDPALPIQTALANKEIARKTLERIQELYPDLFPRDSLHMEDDKLRKFGETTITFGKHSGEKYEDVPTDYLDWIMSRNFDQMCYIRWRIKTDEEAFRKAAVEYAPPQEESPF